MAGKKKIGIIFGGRSAEHEVSIKSAEAIFHHLDKSKFTAELIYISKAGRWFWLGKTGHFSLPEKMKEKGKSFLPWQDINSTRREIEIYFPVLHGPNGEDGKIQGILEMSDTPFIGANSLSSALAMNKNLSKGLFKKAGLKTAEHLFFKANDYPVIKNRVEKYLVYPVFVKPCSLGSSVGISKVKNSTDLKQAVNLAFQFDRSIIIEEGFENYREIEISVMGNDEIIISQPGEIIPYNEFYDYEDKYLLSKTQFIMPAKLKNTTLEELKRITEIAYQSHFLNGMARIDFFIDKKTETVYISEINTIPGFTEISMFPKLMSLQGISFTQLITRLAEYGLAYYRKNKLISKSIDGHL